MAITVAMRTQVSQLYVSLFGRAPDGEGLGFWVNQLDNGQTLAQVAQSMYNVPAARAYYPAFATNEEIVAIFYQNVLGRAVGTDTQGQAFWVAEMNKSGATKGSVIATMLYTVANYTGTDAAGVTSKALFNNKVDVAQFYGEQNGSIAGATTALASVTSDVATVAPAKIAASAAAAASTGQTFTLTTGVDSTGSLESVAKSTSTAGNDTFNAPAGTFSSLDAINGGAGSDTLNWVTTGAVTAGPASAKLTSIETINYTTDNAYTLNLATDAVFSGSGATTFNGLTAGAFATDVTGAATTDIRVTNTTAAAAVRRQRV